MDGIGGTDVEKYSKIWLSDFFHSFPHINLSLVPVNSSFNPQTDDYQQCLYVWAGVPGVACVLLLFAFLIYFVIRCCQGQRKTKVSTSSCSSFWSGVFILTALGLIGFGFYQNEEAHRGFQDCKRSVVDMNLTITTATARVHLLDDLAQFIAGTISDELKEILDEKVENDTLLKKMEEKISRIQTDAETVRTDIDGVKVTDELKNLNDAIVYATDVEYFRWIGQIFLYCIYIIILLMAFIGLLMKSKPVLVLSTCLAVLCSLFIWAATGVYLSTSIALADLCQDPDFYFLTQANASNLNEEAIKAYIICDDTTQPFQNSINNAMDSVSQANKDLNDTVKLAKPFNLTELDSPVAQMRNSLTYANGNLSTLLSDVGSCSKLHADYVDAVDSACQDTLTATAFLTLMSCLIAVVCTFIIFVLACSWRHFANLQLRNRLTYLPVDDTDPFLPRPPQYENHYGTMGHSSLGPWSERGTLQHRHDIRNSSDETVLIRGHHPPIPRDESPPPANRINENVGLHRQLFPYKIEKFILEVDPGRKFYK